jgi:hypothetical protein
MGGGKDSGTVEEADPPVAEKTFLSSSHISIEKRKKERPGATNNRKGTAPHIAGKSTKINLN